MGVMTDGPTRATDVEAFSELERDVPAVEAMGGTCLPLREPGVHVWRVPLAVSQDKLAGLVELLSREERGRMDGFQGDAHKHRFVVAHGAVRLLLAHHLRQHARDLVFALGDHGKPHLATASTLEFNLAHSGELALIALSCRGAVGVDVESLTRRPFDLQPIARRVLATPEQEWLAGTAEASRPGAFLQLWTCKEAVSKAAGGGFTTGFAGIRIEPHRLSPEQPQEVDAAGGRWRLHVLAPGEGYVGALAVAASLTAAD
jgi:4'-phosphopantetheinyl transferase